jgi:hypothetical protein
LTSRFYTSAGGIAAEPDFATPIRRKRALSVSGSSSPFVIFPRSYRTRENHGAMFNHRFTGSVLVNGSPRQVNIQGNPLGRTVIQVDGSTVYDKKPFVQKEVIDFDVLPGKPAKMHWHQISALKMEVDVIVDNRATTLAALAKDGSVRLPVGAKERQNFQHRYTGIGFLVVAAFCFWLNYNELKQTGEYYPKALGIIPALIFMGLASIVHSFVNLNPKSKVGMWVTAAVSLSIVAIGFTFFKDWFLATFATH